MGKMLRTLDQRNIKEEGIVDLNHLAIKEEEEAWAAKAEVQTGKRDIEEAKAEKEEATKIDLPQRKTAAIVSTSIGRQKMLNYSSLILMGRFLRKKSETTLNANS